MQGKVLVKNKVFIYKELHNAKMYQCNKFEALRDCPNTRARMCRGNTRGFLRDSWVYDKYGKLETYTKYHSIGVYDVQDTQRLNGLDINEIFFIEGNFSSDVLNALLSRLSNTSGLLLDYSVVCDEEIKPYIQ